MSTEDDAARAAQALGPWLSLLARRENKLEESQNRTGVNPRFN